jgi:hypothetical protein
MKELNTFSMKELKTFSREFIELISFLNREFYLSKSNFIECKLSFSLVNEREIINAGERPFTTFQINIVLSENINFSEYASHVGIENMSKLVEQVSLDFYLKGFSPNQIPALQIKIRYDFGSDLYRGTIDGINVNSIIGSSRRPIDIDFIAEQIELKLSKFSILMQKWKDNPIIIDPESPSDFSLLEKIRDLEAENRSYRETFAKEQQFLKIERKEISDIKSTLNEKEIELEKRIEQYDERKRQEKESSREYRRKLIKDIHETLNEDDEKIYGMPNEIKTKSKTGKLSSVGNNLEKLRVKIGLICGLGILVSIIFVSIGFSFLPDRNNAIFFLLPGTLSLASTFIYYLRFENNVYHEQSNVSYENRQFRKDILRANWVAELIFESKDLTDIDLPQPILNLFSNELFEKRKKKPIRHPIDDVLKNISNVEKVKIGKDFLEVESNRLLNKSGDANQKKPLE